MFDGDESKYELWEVKFLGHMRLQKLYDVVIPKEGETALYNALYIPSYNQNVFLFLQQSIRGLA